MTKKHADKRLKRAVKYLKKNKSRLLKMAAERGVTAGIALFILPHVFGPVSAMIWGSQHVPPGAKEYVVAFIQDTLQVN